MAYKRPIRTAIYVKAYPGVVERIKIPQSPFRPVQIHSKDLMRKEKDPWWFVLHRKGIYRKKVGEDPREARAVSKDHIRGTLPERIVYKYLTEILKFSPSYDFDFQSSQSGGRLELGGLVADFLFHYMRIVIQVQGSTHSDFLRGRKDEEQKSILTSMGYRVFDIEESVCYNEYQLEEWMRRTFGLALGTGNSGSKTSNLSAGATPSTPSDPMQTLEDYEEEWEDKETLNQIGEIIKRIELELVRM